MFFNDMMKLKKDEVVMKTGNICLIDCHGAHFDTSCIETAPDLTCLELTGLFPD